MPLSTLAVVTVTYHAETHLSVFLEALSHSPEIQQIWIVDNASTDQTIEALQSWNDPRFTLIKNATNQGFATACNQGIKAALAAGADAVILLNPDTVPQTDWVNQLRKSSQLAPDIGIVQATLLLPSQPPVYNSSGNCMHFLGFGFCGDYGKALESSDDREIAFASGAAMLIRKEVLEKVGLLAGEWFMYCEDLEFSLRAQIAGYRVVVSSQAHVIHDYHFERSRLKKYYLERNRLLTILRHYESRTLLMILPALLVTEIAILFYAFGQGWGLHKLATWKEVWKYRSQLSQWRKESQALRTQSDHSLKHLWQSNLDFFPIMHPIIKYLWNPFCKLYWKCINKWI